ncbi:CU044_5270 family protein [Rhizohabitans arisaemae]|uniref:CU044_5270 family protein n=1 Tax=Rhizohabitans arisaemae TaxID=2720610 RepID=UPI0024B068FA|nr:CU044_5270 family protein [Rhizohabitans arisaemae]
MDEIGRLERLREEVPLPRPEELDPERGRLHAAIAAAPPRTAPRRPYPLGFGLRGLGLKVALATGVAAAVTVPLIMTGGDPAIETFTPDRVRLSAAQVLDLAAETASREEELNPRPEQYVYTESQTMYGSFAMTVDENAKANSSSGPGGQSRYLYRTERRIWLSADRSRLGALMIKHLEPRPYPGWPLPAHAKDDVGQVERLPLDDCGRKGPDWSRTDAVYLRSLPTDPEAMREHLYSGQDGKEGADRDYAAWNRAREMLMETYLPPAQRSALFRAAGLIPGVQLVDRAEDAAGREGIAVAKIHQGVSEELLFDRLTYRFLGERAVVTDESQAKSPVGSLIASTAALKVEVADGLPDFAKGFVPGRQCTDVADGEAPPASND